MSKKEEIYNRLVKAVDVVKEYAKKYPRYGIKYDVTDDDFEKYAELLIETVAYEINIDG